MSSSNLDRIEFNFAGIGEAISDNILRVPVYQRAYSWETKEKDKNVEVLFTDIESAMKDGVQEYFLGTVVLAKEDKDYSEVVDGQQRIATITILLAAIRDYVFEKNEESEATDLERDFLFTKIRLTQELVPILRLNETDHEYFEHRILERPDSDKRNITPIKRSHELINEAAILAKERINRITLGINNPLDELRRWVNFIEKQVKVIWLTVPDTVYAFTIFETLNDRGLRLAVSDLLKNYLFRLSGERIEEVKNWWNGMVEILESLGDEEISVTYIRHFWSSMYGLTREKELYREIKGKINSKQKAMEFARQLYENAKLYVAIQTSDHEFWGDYDKAVREYIQALNDDLRIEQYRPLLLAILIKFSSDKKEILRSLKILESWAVRFLISGGGGGTLEKAYSDNAAKITNGTFKTVTDLVNEMNKIVPSDIIFEGDFSRSSVSVSKHHLA